MAKPILHRLLSIPIVLACVMIVNFLLFHLSPGDPTNLYFNPNVSMERQELLRQKMGLQQPWYQQLWTYTSRAVQGDLGYSWSKHRPVSHVLADAIPATLGLTLLALIINLVLGCSLGMVAGLYSRRWIGKLLSGTSLLLYSIPSFWLALVLIYIFSLKLGWLPASGLQSFATNLGSFETIWDRLRHVILPATVLGLVGAAATFRFVYAKTRQLLDKEFMLMARAKGLPTVSIVLKHALRNVLLPVITLIGLYFPFILGGALIVEVIFAWPGMGRVTYEAVFAKDFPVIMAVNGIAALLVILGNVLADVVYRVVDPRIEFE